MGQGDVVLGVEEPQTVALPELLEGHSRGAIGEVNHPAAGEAAAEQGRLHGLIVGVGVDADVGADAAAEATGGFDHARGGAVGGDAVDGAVGRVVEPVAAFYMIICGIFAEDEGEDEADAAVGVDAHVGVACGDVAGDVGATGVLARPLVEVAAAAHILLGEGVDSQRRVNVREFCFANGNHGAKLSNFAVIANYPGDFLKKVEKKLVERDIFCNFAVDLRPCVVANDVTY